MFLFGKKKSEAQKAFKYTSHVKKPSFQELEDLFRNPDDDIPKKHQTQKIKKA